MINVDVGVQVYGFQVVVLFGVDNVQVGSWIEVMGIQVIILSDCDYIEYNQCSDFNVFEVEWIVFFISVGVISFWLVGIVVNNVQGSGGDGVVCLIDFVVLVDFFVGINDLLELVENLKVFFNLVLDELNV